MWERVAAIAALGIVLVLVFAFAYGWPRSNQSGRSVRRTLSPTFARVYGLMSIAILAVVTVVFTSDSEVLTGVFTLFGTIAGYLAGSKAQAIGGNPSDPAGGGDGDGDGDGTPRRNVASLELN